MDARTNPLLIEWEPPFELPPFGRIAPGDFPPAFELAMREHREQLDRINGTTAAPGFDDTPAALDRSAALLRRIEMAFYNLTASATSPELQAVQREMAPRLAAHWSAVLQDEALFARLDAVHRRRTELGLSAEQIRLVERQHRDFVFAGARLPAAERRRYADVMQSLAELTTQFGQNVLRDEASWSLPLPDEAAMAGLPAFVRAAATQAAADRGREQPLITLSRSLVVPFLTFSTRRDLREMAWRAWVGRGEQPGASDNRPVAARILALRREQARLLGHASYADLALSDTMAGTPDRVWALLDEVWRRAVPALEAETAVLEEVARRDGWAGAIEPWDWRFLAEKVRCERFALDEAELKPYFALPHMVQALFDCAGRLFGLRFERRDDLQAYHPDVAAYEVRDARGGSIGLFLQDNFSRPSKRSGAWMSALRWQHRNGEGGRAVQPVVLNNNNFARAAPGQPTLLSQDDVRTLFHEFGHGLHGLLSDVSYQRLSGTQVLRDFVELPSQLFEHWGRDREVLRRHARHHLTGEPIPQTLIDRLDASRLFGSAYETVRYTASAIVDLAAHQSVEPIDDVVAFEAKVMAERGLPACAGMNHRLPHFQHLFSGSSYAAGYYVYLWAEVLEADAFGAFVEAGDPFDPSLARRLRESIYARGDSVDPRSAYLDFRGRDAMPEPMLRQRGLVSDGSAAGT